LNPDNKQFVASPATGADLLAMLAGPYTGTYVPQGVPPGYTWHGSLSPSALTANVEYAGGAAHCSGLLCSCDPPGPCSVDRCSGPVVSVDVTSTFVTTDGTFNEQVDATLSPESFTDVLDLEGTLPATALHGSYEISFGPASAVSLDFNAYLSGGHVTGDITEATSSITGGGGAIQ
jgi:hypothetical protein